MPAKIIPLFPDKIGRDPLQHPVIKTFLHDAAIATKISDIESRDDVVVLQWITEDLTTMININVSLGTAIVEGYDEVGFKCLDATVQVGKNTRWIGYYIDDNS